MTGAFSNIREIGLFLDGRNNIKGSKWVIKPSINITTGDGYGFKFNSKDFGGSKYGARVNFLPFGLFRNFGQFRQGDLVRELNPKLLIDFRLVIMMVLQVGEVEEMVIFYIIILVILHLKEHRK